jgi:hypothetical protein
MNLQEFLQRLPRMASPISLVVDQGEAFDPSPEPVAGYVPPTFTEADWPAGATVVLIEAAGAVGKTAAAQAIASQLNWPLVRVEKAQVGSYSLSGLIQDGTGFGSTFISDVASGSAGVVIDSLDEAHFRAGTENFLAFLDNVWKVSGRANKLSKRQPSVVLMSRSDTAELVRLAFLDADVPLAHVNLDFFDLDSAHRFIRVYMARRFTDTRRKEYNVPLASPAPFEQLRDGRMKQIAAVLTRRENVDLRREWSDVRDFLGYTPVLIAMAESLAVTNPASERPSLTAKDQSNLLREIIEHILGREQRKFSDHLRSKLQSLLPADVDGHVVSESLYRPPEQCARLIAFVNGRDLEGSLAVALPDAIQPIYEEAVRTFLPDHPFIKSRNFASLVFADFVSASACLSPEIRVSLPLQPEDLIDSVGPFFARFLANDLLDSPPSIAEALVEQVVSSWIQESDLIRAQDSDVMISLTDGEGLLACSRKSGGAHSEQAELEFEILDMSGAFQIKNHLKRTTIATDQGVILGEAGKQFSLGPRVIIVAQEIVVEAETVRVETERGKSQGAALAGEVIVANRLKKVEAGARDLHVFSSKPPAHLRPYMRELVVGKRFIPFQRYLDLRSILTAFRPSTKGGLAVLAAKMEGKIVKSNAHRLSNYWAPYGSWCCE